MSVSPPPKKIGGGQTVHSGSGQRSPSLAHLVQARQDWYGLEAESIGPSERDVCVTCPFCWLFYLPPKGEVRPLPDQGKTERPEGPLCNNCGSSPCQWSHDALNAQQPP